MKAKIIWAGVLVLAVAAVVFYHDWQHWLAFATGSYNCPKTGCPGGVAHNYNFFSGSGSDITELTILGAIAGMYHKHNCNDKGCWRIGKHSVDGTPWCNKHHHGARERRDAREKIDAI